MLMDPLYLVAFAVIATDSAPRLPVLEGPVHPHLPTDFVVFPISRDRSYFKLLLYSIKFILNTCPLIVVFIIIQSCDCEDGHFPQ